MKKKIPLERKTVQNLSKNASKLEFLLKILYIVKKSLKDLLLNFDDWKKFLQLKNVKTMNTRKNYFVILRSYFEI